MTACVNEEKKTKGGALSGKVARTFLAGALAASMVPSVAYATDGIDASSATVMSATQAGNLSIAFDETNLTYTGESQKVTVTVTSQLHDMPSGWTVKLVDADENVVSSAALSSEWEGSAGAWTQTADLSVTELGTYTAWVNDGVKGDFVPADANYLTVNAVAASEIDANWDGEQIGWNEGKDLTETANEHLVVEWDGYRLVQGVDYDVAWSQTPLTGQEGEDTNVTATLTYKGNFTGQDTVNVKILGVTVESAADDFAGGELTRALDNENASIEAPFSFVYDGDVHFIQPKELTTAKGKVVDLTAKDGDQDVYTVKTYAVNSFDPVTGEPNGYNSSSTVSPVMPGYYATVVTAGNSAGEYKNATFVQYFQITAASLEGTVAVDECAPAFTWNGEDHADEISFELDGRTLTTADDIVVTWYKADGEKAQQTGTVIEPGDYVAKVTGKASGGYEGSEVEIPVTIKPIDLSSAVLTIDDMVYDGDAADLKTVPVSASWVDAAGELRSVALDGKVDLKVTSGQSLVLEKGAYTVSVAPNAAANEDAEYVANEGSVSFAVVGEVVTDFRYEGTAFADVANEVFNLDRGESLDVDDIEVFDGKGNKLDSSEWTLTVADAETGEVVADWATKAGDYVATVSVNYGSDYAMGGKDSFSFKVVAGTLSESDVFVSFDGVTIDAAPTEKIYWNGSDQSSRFAIKVQKDGKVLSEGTDYEWYFTKDGERVDSLTEVGTYVLHVDGLAWAGEVSISSIEVEKLDVFVAATGTKSFADRGANPARVGYAYTGEAIVPSFGWSEDVSPSYYDGLEGDFAAADYSVLKYQMKDENSVWVDVDEVKAAGDYRAFLEFGESVASCMNIDATTIEFSVIDRLEFNDVLAKDWYSERVYDAWAAGYINGYSGTALFGPDNAIKRGDVACILFNVACNGGYADVDHWTNQGSSYSAFSDVEPGVYWTGAINWAANAGVVNGFSGTDLFGAEQNVTREQFASMLANFAKAMKLDTAEGVDVSGMPGAEGVSDWALENVEWAVANGIMGNNGADLNAQGTITRAEVAAMVMNFMEIDA